MSARGTGWALLTLAVLGAVVVVLLGLPRRAWEPTLLVLAVAGVAGGALLVVRDTRRLRRAGGAPGSQADGAPQRLSG